MPIGKERFPGILAPRLRAKWAGFDAALRRARSRVGAELREIYSGRDRCGMMSFAAYPTKEERRRIEK